MLANNFIIFFTNNYSLSSFDNFYFFFKLIWYLMKIAIYGLKDFKVPIVRKNMTNSFPVVFLTPGISLIPIVLKLTIK